jgi:hypothetical protein
MDIATALSFAREFLVLICIFGALFAYAIVRGKRALIALILGLYIALLISLEFPYYEAIFNMTSREGNSEAMVTIGLFAIFTMVSAFLAERLISYEYEERAFEGIGKKILLAMLGTVLILTYSYHVLPITTIVDPGATISSLFAPREYFFWLLMIPLAGLFII